MDLDSYLNNVKQNIKKISNCQDVNKHLEIYNQNKDLLETCKQIINSQTEFKDDEKKYRNYNLFQIKNELEIINDKINESKHFEEIEKLYSIAKFLKQKSKDIIKELKISIQYV